MKNYRPISLTNVDYEIFTQVLANRLQKVANRVIGRKQSAYIKGKYIGENARFILDIFEYYMDNNICCTCFFIMIFVLIKEKKKPFSTRMIYQIQRK